MKTRKRKPFTGYHAALILVLFFGTIAAVNFTMASYATSTFGGVVVKNSYVASQEFNNWLEKADEQKSWGWNVASEWQEDGHIAVSLSDVPSGARVTGMARHPVGQKPDVALTFGRSAAGQYVANEALASERWILRLQIEADGKIWRGEEYIR